MCGAGRENTTTLAVCNAASASKSDNTLIPRPSTNADATNIAPSTPDAIECNRLT